MKRLIIVLSVVLCLQVVSFGHGGQYRGPGSSAPPSPGSSGGNVSAPPSGASGTTASPSAKSGTGAVAKRRGGSAGGLQKKGGAAGGGYARWEFWWEYNKDAYLDLKNKLFGTDRISGSGSFLTGRSPKDQFHTSRKATGRIMQSRVLPLLIEALKMDHPDVQDSSVLAMARITYGQDAAMVMNHIQGTLDSKHQTAQQSACLSLGVLGSPEAIPLCRDLMFNTSRGRKLVGENKVPRLVRAFAALSLGLIGSDEAVPDLMRIIDTENSMTQKDLLSCAITSLGLMAQSPRQEEIVKYLCKLLRHPEMDPFLKANIPTALGRLGSPDALPSLLSAFREEKQNEWVRQSCAIAFGQLADLDGNSEIVKRLMDYIREGRDVQTKHLSFIALGQIGARDEAYEPHAGQHDKLSRFFLSEMEKPSRYSHRAWASLAAAVHAMSHPVLQAEVIECVARRFDDSKNPSDKAAFAISLGLLDAKKYAPDLFETLTTSKDKMLQGYLCVGIGLMKWTSAAERIREFAADEQVFLLRLQASVALGLMGDTKAMEVLVNALQDGQTLHIISSSAKALGHIGDVNAIDPLQEILDDEQSSELSKAFAVVALGLMGEKSSLPWNARISKNCNYMVSTPALFEVLDIL